MKATRKTIPTLIKEREEFVNESGTMYSYRYPGPLTVENMVRHSANATEKSKLRIDRDISRITYIVVSYDTPIAWENDEGDFHIITASVSQTTDQHVGLVRLSELED